jgi:hypothetical protein
MQQQRSHHHYTAPGNRHDTFFPDLTRVERLDRVQATQPVGARDHPQRTVALVAIVEMDTDGNHVFEHGGRRLNEENALFLRPARALCAVDAFGDWNAQILVE